MHVRRSVRGTINHILYVCSYNYIIFFYCPRLFKGKPSTCHQIYLTNRIINKIHKNRCVPRARTVRNNYLLIIVSLHQPRHATLNVPNRQSQWSFASNTHNVNHATRSIVVSILALSLTYYLIYRVMLCAG